MPNWFTKIPLRTLPELDSLRFISIFLVIFHHLLFTSNSFFSWFKTHGWIGVDIFFGMSGFLITGLLLKEREKMGTIALKDFWVKRMFRLWPSWLFTLFLTIIMVSWIGRNQPSVELALREMCWHYFLHFGNYSHIFFGKIHTLFLHFWSLAVEEHFYLLWPVILIFSKSRRTITWVIFGIVILSWALRYYHISQGASVSLISFSTHTRLDELVLGCCLAIYFNHIKAPSLFQEIALTALMIILYALGLYLCKENPTSHLLNSLTYTFVGIANCFLIIIALKGSKYGVRFLLSSPTVARLGVLSYGVYLIHMLVNFVVFPLSKKFGLENQWIIAFLNFVLPFALAYGMYFLIDERFGRLRRSLSLGTNPHSQASPN